MRTNVRARVMTLPSHEGSTESRILTFFMSNLRKAMIYTTLSDITLQSLNGVVVKRTRIKENLKRTRATVMNKNQKMMFRY